MAMFSVKVVPGASSDSIVGWLGDDLKVRVSAPPEKGKANAAVGKLLATTLRLAKDQVRIVSGQSSPRKVFEVVGLSEEELREKLEAALRDGSS